VEKVSPSPVALSGIHTAVCHMGGNDLALQACLGSGEIGTPLEERAKFEPSIGSSSLLCFDPTLVVDLD